MKFEGQVTPRKGIDEETSINWFNLTIKLPMIDLIIYWKLPIITNKYLLKMRALHYTIII
jgi:hypothetical protein